MLDTKQSNDADTASGELFIGKDGLQLLQVYPKYDVWQRKEQEDFVREVRTVAPKARIVVTGYPLLLDSSVPQAGFVNAGVLALNEVIASAVALAGDKVVYVDVVNAFLGHGIGSTDAWILAPPDMFAFHPTAEGYTAYADAIRSAL